MWQHDLNTVLADARMLQHAAQTNSTRTLLRGKKLALLSEFDPARDADDARDGDASIDTASEPDTGDARDGARDGARDAALFRRAALELGAHVAHIRPSLSQLGTPQDVQHTARMLGRLYDAVECQGMAAALVRQLGGMAGVPVYDGITSATHPSARLVALLGDDTSPVDNRRFVLQAVLLGTLA